MPIYRFRAVNTLGQVLKGQMTAANENHLASRLADMGYELMMFRAHQRVHWLKFWTSDTTSRQYVVLFSQLAALAQAGLPLVTCLEDTAVTMPDSSLRKTVRAITQNLREGSDFVDACALHRHAFAPAVITALQAGCAQHHLPETFARLRDHFTWLTQYGGKLRYALNHRLILLAGLLGVTSILLVLALPPGVWYARQQQLGGQAVTALLAQVYTISLVLRWAVPLGLIGITLVTLALRASTNIFRRVSDALILWLPGFGSTVTMIDRSFFFHHAAMLVGNGVSVHEALTVARTTIVNTALQSQATQLIHSMARGNSIATACCGLPAFSRRFVRPAVWSLTDEAELFQQLSQAADTVTERRARHLTYACTALTVVLVSALLAWLIPTILIPSVQACIQYLTDL